MYFTSLFHCEISMYLLCYCTSSEFSWTADHIFYRLSVKRRTREISVQFTQSVVRFPLYQSPAAAAPLHKNPWWIEEARGGGALWVCVCLCKFHTGNRRKKCRIVFKLGRNLIRSPSHRYRTQSHSSAAVLATRVEEEKRRIDFA